MVPDSPDSRVRSRAESRFWQVVAVIVIAGVLVAWVLSLKHNAELAARRRGLPSGLVLTTLSDSDLEWERRVIAEVLENKSDKYPDSIAKITADLSAIKAEQSRRAAMRLPQQ